MENFDLLILGGGPGGYVSAIRAAQLGMRVGLIEKNKLGGVCVNIGCIPSKALIRQAKLFESMTETEKLGVVVDRTGFDYGKVFAKSRKAADTLSKGVAFLMKKNDVTVIEGKGVLKSPREIKVGGKIYGAKNILIATGSSPIQLPTFPFDEDRVLSSTGALMLSDIPRSVAILGSGAIGMEFAYIFSSFGVTVHLIEMMPRLMPLEDVEVSVLMERAFKKRKIKIHTATKAEGMEKGNQGLVLHLRDEKGRESGLEVEKLLVAVGRRPNTANIGLENIGVAPDKRGFIETGEGYQTNVRGVYAIGDVVPTPMLAHVASWEGKIAVESMAGLDVKAKPDPLAIPAATYCQPEVASFGLREWQAKERHVPYEKTVFNYRGVGKAVAIEQSEGFAKVLYAPKSHAILGVHIVGAQATELIHEWLFAKHSGLLPQDIAGMMHAHPTLSELNMEAAMACEEHS